MTEYQLNIQKNINELQEQKKKEIMKMYNTFVLNPKIKEIDESIANYRAKCNHEFIINNRCKICGKTIN